MKGFWRRLHGMTSGCGTLPLFGAAALILAARVEPVLERPLVGSERKGVTAPRSPDMELIEQILSKRAPDLGLKLRRRVAHAIAEEAGRAGYDPLLILAIIDVESDFVQGAVSHRGAKGLMQIQPTTLHFLAQREGLRLAREEVAADPALCVRLGVRYLRQLHDRFGDLDRALMAYNCGPTKLRKWNRGGEPEVLKTYVRMVRRDFKRFREGEGLGGDWALAQRSTEPAP